MGIMESKYHKLRGFSLFKKKFLLRNCSAYGKQVVITPEGNIGPCQGLWPQFNNKENNLFFQLDLNSNLEDFYRTYSDWYSRLPINMIKCWKCPAIAICGGGCARNSILKYNDIWSPDENFCEEMRLFLEWCIWDNYYVQKRQWLVIFPLKISFFGLNSSKVSKEKITLEVTLCKKGREEPDVPPYGH